MEILLNDTQINVVKQKQAMIQANQIELNHAQEKLNDFITGVATSKGVMGKFSYTIKDNTLVIEFPEVKPPIEE